MITINGLTKHYGPLVAVNNATFSVSPGTITGFLGPNGAGKSTTLRLLLGLENPTGGDALIDGQPYRSLARPMTVVGALLDAGWVHPRRSGRNHLRWMAATNGISAARVDECLDIVGLTDAAGRRAGEYSLGMRQRLGLAGALLGDPLYLVFDEPLNGLDPEGIRWMRSLMRRFADEGRGVLVSSHMLSEVAQTVDDIVIIARGRARGNAPISDYVQSGTSLEDAFFAEIAGEDEYRGRV
ncbi:MAG: ATP-binding cassette domain-containing protein [Propionibacteriaceae bacterium]|nr:ATP-binding cassette domain-containing protein [Propionibacteriaceae bacterium]